MQEHLTGSQICPPAPDPTNDACIAPALVGGGRTCVDQELTSTQIDLLAAQIIDRMARAIQGARDKADILDRDFGADQDNPTDTEIAERNQRVHREVSEARRRLSIPVGVHLFQNEGLFESDRPHDWIADWKPFIRYWAEGSLTGWECWCMTFWLEALDEIDYGWVFFQEPLWFYGGEGKEGEHDNGILARIDYEFQAFGSRRQRKHKGKKFWEGGRTMWPIGDRPTSELAETAKVIGHNNEYVTDISQDMPPAPSARRQTRTFFQMFAAATAIKKVTNYGKNRNNDDMETISREVR